MSDRPFRHALRLTLLGLALGALLYLAYLALGMT